MKEKRTNDYIVHCDPSSPLSMTNNGIFVRSPFVGLFLSKRDLHFLEEAARKKTKNKPGMIELAMTSQFRYSDCHGEHRS